MLPPDPDPPICDADPLARALAALRPAPAGVDGQKLLYLAGQAARDRAVTFWRRVCVAQGVLVVAGGGWAAVHVAKLNESLSHADGPRVVERIRYVEAPREPGPDELPLGAVEPAPMPRPVPPPAYPPPQEFARKDPAGGDLAEYLRVRREVLTAGLGVLPDARRRPGPAVTPAEWEKSLHLPPGVLTSPYGALPKPKPKPAEPEGPSQPPP